MHCVNDWAARSYAHQQGIDESRQDAIEKRAEELMQKGGRFYPFSLDNVMEFFGAMMPHQELMLQVAIETPDANLCGMLRNWIVEYWRLQALRQTEKEAEKWQSPKY